MNITVVGDGKWGSAMASLLKKNKKDFKFWRRGGELPDDSILVMCIPTQAIREVLTNYGSNLKNVIYVNGAKGVERNSHKLPYEIATEILGKNLDYYSLIGPSFAEEIHQEMPTLVNLGFVRDRNTSLVRELFQTDYFRVRVTKGVHALELASAFKNVYAIACGMTYGLGFETNTRTKLIILAIEEFYALSKKMRYSIDKKALPGTIGDLILTCNSEESRNFRFGQLLAKRKVNDALKNVGETVEGYSTVESVPYFETKSELPLARFVYDVIHEDNHGKIEERFQDFVKSA